MSLVLEAARYPAYGTPSAMAYSTDRDGSPVEGGTVRFAWDKQGLHLDAVLEDSSLIALNRDDEQLHYESGDVFELFLKPTNALHKWEMYATPFGNKSTLFFPTWPTPLSPQEALENHEYRELNVVSEITETGWKVRMFVPASQLTALGSGWGDGTEWTVLCGRYNYNSEDLLNPELTMVPALSTTDYHLTDEYGRLVLLP
ncbi:hypothetical protein PDESU_02619 [Pontiella desulfatans]|uniref:Carbohydrate-binding domain-containing protein n=1 Tax=Pontiella desulfatans TaxID=2750659 RepID=A0A6C2U258_PONDE|nr:hypothetical protein [Pontiella desulfatans]VGO14062.1 hypothetical protein PDESU_02619 [Pontiella desulfatans]